MEDEKYVFIQDQKEKKITSRSAKNRRAHNGKGGRPRFPSDNLSQKELKALSGEVKSYRLNEPMTWAEFRTMPDDLQITYIKLLRKRFNVSDTNIGKMLNVSQRTISKHLIKLKCSANARGGGTKWDENGWNKWVNRMAALPETVEQSTTEEVSEPFMEDDVYFPEEPEHMESDPATVYGDKRAIPRSGTMTLEGGIEDVLNTVTVLLGGAEVSLCVSWEVHQKDGVCEHG